jgi:hypothetical protein
MRSLATLFGLIIVPCALSAQRTGVAAAGRIAGIAAPVVHAERVVAPPPGSFLIGGVPVLVLPDGRMFADFGYGYEPITRGCGGAVLYVQSVAIPVQPAVVQPTVAQPTVGVSERLPYTPPVPAQQTASQQMLSQQGSSSVAPAARTGFGANSACLGIDPRGQYILAR